MNVVTKKQDESAGFTKAPRASFGPQALQAKYQEEREKRLRADAIDQYVEIAGIHSCFERDPWVEGIFEDCRLWRENSTSTAERSSRPS